MESSCPQALKQLSTQISLASDSGFANVLSTFVPWNKVLSNYMLIKYPFELTRHHPFERSWFFLGWRTAIYTTLTDMGMSGYLFFFSFVSIGSVYFKKPTFSLSFKIWVKSSLYHVFIVYSVQKSGSDGPSCVLESSNLYL